MTLSVADAPGPYGLFGDFESLTLVFDNPLHDRRVLAQDLAGDEPIDISSMVQVRGRSVWSLQLRQDDRPHWNSRQIRRP